MTIDFNGIMNDLFQGGLVIAGVVLKKGENIVYCSSNWSIELNDLKNCISGWNQKAQFVMLQGIKYSMLLSQLDFFSAINYKDKNWLVGAASPEENGNQYYIVGFAPAGTSGNNAYVDVARAAGRMREGGSYKPADAPLGKQTASDVPAGAFRDATASAAAPAPAAARVDPSLKQEIDGFLQWIKDPNGLSGYISYYLQQNDPNVIAKLAKAYNDFRQVFGF